MFIPAEGEHEDIKQIQAILEKAAVKKRLQYELSANSPPFQSSRGLKDVRLHDLRQLLLSSSLPI